MVWSYGVGHTKFGPYKICHTESAMRTDWLRMPNSVWQTQYTSYAQLRMPNSVWAWQTPYGDHTELVIRSLDHTKSAILSLIRLPYGVCHTELGIQSWVSCIPYGVCHTELCIRSLDHRNLPLVSYSLPYGVCHTELGIRSWAYEVGSYGVCHTELGIRSWAYGVWTIQNLPYGVGSYGVWTIRSLDHTKSAIRSWVIRSLDHTKSAILSLILSLPYGVCHTELGIQSWAYWVGHTELCIRSLPYGVVHTELGHTKSAIILSLDHTDSAIIGNVSESVIALSICAA